MSEGKNEPVTEQKEAVSQEDFVAKAIETMDPDDLDSVLVTMQEDIEVQAVVTEEVVQQTVTETDDSLNDKGNVKVVEPTKANVTQEFDCELPASQGSPDKISLPPEAIDVIHEKLAKTPEISLDATKNQYTWSTVLTQSLGYMPLLSTWASRLAEPEADFRQTVDYKGTSICTTMPQSKRKPGTVELEGESALLQMVTHLGVGALARVPMYNSGFWVYFKPAAEFELLELNATLASDKIRLGRESYGLTHSNSTVFSVNRIFQMALRHVYATSVSSNEMPVSDIAKHLKPQDLYPFIYGFLCANYPSGFKYNTACINDPEKCQHIFEGVINLAKLQVVDNNALSDTQKNFMTGTTSNSRSLEAVKKYQEEISRMHDRRIILNKDTTHEMAITLNTPSVGEYLDQGMRYISSIVDSVNRSMEVDTNNNERNAFMRSANNAGSLCQYIHYVKSIEFGHVSAADGDRRIIVDRKTVLDALKVLSATDSIRETIIKEVLDYISYSTLSIIAIPAYDCPVCGKEQDDKSKHLFPRHKAFIPLDMIQVFFGLHAQRINRIENR